MPFLYAEHILGLTAAEIFSPPADSSKEIPCHIKPS